MKKIKKYSVISSLVSINKDRTYMFVTIAKDLFESKYSPYQRAFILHIMNNGESAKVTARTKQNIWFKTVDSKKIRLKYEEEITQLEADGFIECKTDSRFGYKTYTLLPKSFGAHHFTYSSIELFILLRGL